MAMRTASKSSAVRGSRNACRPIPIAAERSGLDRVAEDLGDADLAAAVRLVLEADHPPGDHRPRRDDGPGSQLEGAELRQPALEPLLGLADRHAGTPRLLADRAAHRSREVPGLDPGDAERRGMDAGQPMALLGRDGKTEARVPGSRTSRPSRHASSRPAGSGGTRPTGPAPAHRTGPRSHARIIEPQDGRRGRPGAWTGTRGTGSGRARYRRARPGPDLRRGRVRREEDGVRPPDDPRRGPSPSSAASGAGRSARVALAASRPRTASGAR